METLRRVSVQSLTALILKGLDLALPVLSLYLCSQADADLLSLQG